MATLRQGKQDKLRTSAYEINTKYAAVANPKRRYTVNINREGMDQKNKNSLKRNAKNLNNLECQANFASL